MKFEDQEKLVDTVGFIFLLVVVFLAALLLAPGSCTITINIDDNSKPTPVEHSQDKIKQIL